MDKVLEYLENRLTPSIFITIVIIVGIISLFKKEIFLFVKKLFIYKRTRVISTICLASIIAIIVITCSITFKWWQQLLFLIGLLFLCALPHLSAFFINPAFFFRYKKFKKNRYKAIELIEEYEKIYEYAINTREKVLFTFLLFDYCELSGGNYQKAYIYFSKLNQDKLYFKEIVKFKELYGIVLISIGSLNLGMKYLKEANTFLAKDRLAVAYEIMDDKEEALKIMNELRDEALSKNLDIENKAMAFNDYARVYALCNGPLEALRYYKEALKYANKSKHYVMSFVIYSNIISTLLMNNELTEGLKYYDEFLAYLNKQEETINKKLEECNLKMMVSRLTNNVELMDEAIQTLDNAIENYPLKEKLLLASQIMEIKANYRADISKDILNAIKYKNDINALDIPIKERIYNHFEHVLFLFHINPNGRLSSFKEMVDEYYDKQMYIDAMKYATEIPVACVFEKNRWLLDKYIYMIRKNEIDIKEFKNRFNEIVQSYIDNNLKYEEMNARMRFVKEMFYIDNVVDTTATILKSKYESYALEQVNIVDEYILNTPYRRKIEGLIFEAFVFTYFCGDLITCEMIYQLFRKEHPDNRLIDPQINDEFLKILNIYESGRIVIS